MLRKFKISIDGQEYLVEMEEITEGAAERLPTPSPVTAAAPEPAASVAQPAVQPAPVAQKSTSGVAMPSPMPGTILTILAKAGDVVEENQPILILEAMKLENEVVADRAGTISQILVSQGQVVNAGDDLVIIS